MILHLWSIEDNEEAAVSDILLCNLYLEFDVSFTDFSHIVCKELDLRLLAEFVSISLGLLNANLSHRGDSSESRSSRNKPTRAYKEGYLNKNLTFQQDKC